MWKGGGGSSDPKYPPPPWIGPCYYRGIVCIFLHGDGGGNSPCVLPSKMAGITMVKMLVQFLYSNAENYSYTLATECKNECHLCAADVEFSGTSIVPLGENGTFLCISGSSGTVPAWHLKFRDGNSQGFGVVPSVVTLSRTYVYDYDRGVSFTFDEEGDNPDFSSVLIIKGSMQNNGTCIRCDSYSSGITNDGDKQVELQVFGMNYKSRP